MKKEKGINKQKRRAGRKPKESPAIYRHDIRLNSIDSCRFETLFELSGYKYRGHFIRDKVLNSPLRIIERNKSEMDFIIKLSQFRGLFSRIGNNYNQLLRLLKEQLGERKALAYLYKLEKATIQLVILQRTIDEFTNKMEEKWLQK